MGSTTSAAERAGGGTRAGAARQRVLGAAVDLFAENGVSGTSLQMIADRLGVTKAAVYHQFQSKEDIVLGLITPALEHISEIIGRAEQARSRSTAVDITLRGLIDLLADNRRLGAVLWDDPTVTRVVQQHPLLQQVGARFTRQLAGPDDTDVEARIRASMILGALKAATDPALADIDLAELRVRMLDLARRFMGVRAAR